MPSTFSDFRIPTSEFQFLSSVIRHLTSANKKEKYKP